MSRRSPDSRNDTLDRIDPEELKIIKVTVRRRNLEDPVSTAPLQRSLDDPFHLKVHFRPEEGIHPIFHKIFPLKEERSLSQTTSRSGRDLRSSTPVRTEQKQSPQPHCSKDYSRDEPRKDYSRKDDIRREETRKDYNSSRYRRSHSRTISRSPHKYRSSRSPDSRRRKEFPYSRDKSPHRYYGKQRSSRSPVRRSERSPPPKHRDPSERKRTRSPPPRSRPRSRSRSRYSRSPHRHDDYRRYERSPRRRSRSPRRHSRYTPDRSYQSSRIPNPYFEGAEFWIPNPMMQPRFIPRHMMPAAAFPYAAFRPGMPPPFPPRAPFRPRIVYNSVQRNRTPAVTQGTNEERVTAASAEAESSEGKKDDERVGGDGQTEHSVEKTD